MKELPATILLSFVLLPLTCNDVVKHDKVYVYVLFYEYHIVSIFCHRVYADENCAIYEGTK